jgi:hypothetical protein
MRVVIGRSLNPPSLPLSLLSQGFTAGGRLYPLVHDVALPAWVSQDRSWQALDPCALPQKANLSQHLLMTQLHEGGSSS